MSDTTRQPAPAGGMQRIPFPLETYTHMSKPLSSKRLVNFFAEKQPDDSRSPVALMPTPGLQKFANLECGAGPVWAINVDMPGYMYIASGTHFYRATVAFGETSFTIEDLGDIGAASSIDDYPRNLMVTIASGITGVVVCVPPNAFTATHNGPLNQIGGTFPGASSVCYMDGYYCFTNKEPNAEWFISRLLDPNNFDALDFAYADAVPNVARRIVPLRGELWIVGDKATEVWYNSGDADFPFRRRAGGVIYVGTDSMKTVAVADGSVWWVGVEGNAFRSNGYHAQMISTPAVSQALRDAGTNAVVCGFTYMMIGHTFYCVTYGNRTFCYDASTQSWAERSTGGTENAWFALCAADAQYDTVFGTSASGRIFQAIPNLVTEDGAAIARLAQLPPLWANTRRAFCARLEIEMEVGRIDQAPAVLLQWSDDGGNTWTTGRMLSIDQAGNYRQRLYTTRLGSFRQRTFRLVFNEWRAILYGVDADIVAGAH